MMYDTILKAIGNTPLVRLNFDTPAAIYAKLEYLNPSGSVKDRAALFMIEEAERTGKLKPGGTIIEASSGNQGISAAMIGSAKGYNVIVTVSDKVSLEKRNMLRAYGATVIAYPTTLYLTDPESYHSKALEIHKNTPNSFMLNQYFNPDNARAHYTLTGPEIWNQTKGAVTHLCVAAGSCGTLSGAGKFLKEKNPAVKVIGIDALTSYRSTKGNPQPYKAEGLGVDFNAPLLDDSIIDQFLVVSDDQICLMLNELARKHGILVGPASGAAAYAAREYARTLNANDVVITLFTDSGRSYLTKNFYV
jgi:cystathionine beta-synthase